MGKFIYYLKGHWPLQQIVGCLFLGEFSSKVITVDCGKEFSCYKTIEC